MNSIEIWSELYFPNLPQYEHDCNNNWFKSMLAMLKDDGQLYVPILNKSFNKLGEEINNE